MAAALLLKKGTTRPRCERLTWLGFGLGFRFGFGLELGLGLGLGLG